MRLGSDTYFGMFLNVLLCAFLFEWKVDEIDVFIFVEGGLGAGDIGSLRF